MTRTLAFCTGMLLAVAPAQAQDRKWDVEIYGGGAIASPATAGSVSLPAAGTALVTSNPTFPSRETPSWLFGDGAALLNGVLADFDGAARVTPLDSLFSPARGARGGAIGVRVHRQMDRRWSMELALDVAPAARSAPQGFAAAVEETRRTFGSAFAELLATGPFTGVSIDATATASDSRQRETTATVAFAANTGAWHAWVPYATIGGGLNASSGRSASADIEASYRFSILGDIPIAEADHVSLRYDRRPAFVIVLGGGVRRALSEVWGVSVDARAFTGPDRSRVLLDAQPSNTRGTPSGFVESFTNPGIQFSNDPSIGRRSSLSAPALTAQRVFSGGMRSRIVLSAGISRRF